VKGRKLLCFQLWKGNTLISSYIQPFQ
jgi:hypothetical protein